MDLALGSLLFAGKWLFIGLIYLMLVVVLVAVRREMGQRLTTPELPAAVVPGRLKVIHGGSDPALTPGLILNLSHMTVLGAAVAQLGKKDLIIRDHYVSGRHARLSWDGVNWWVEDLDSANGTIVNGLEIPLKEKVHLPFGATVRTGDAIFELLT
jgi:hypothetical protein